MTEQYYKNTAYGAILKPSSVIEREREREREMRTANGCSAISGQFSKHTNYVLLYIEGFPTVLVLI